MRIHDFYEQGTGFVDHAFHKVLEAGLNILTYNVDHLCYRVQTMERYNLMKEFLAPYAKLLSEVPINGRLISTFKLHAPIPAHECYVPLVEIPAPKINNLYQEGFEHLEIVVPSIIQFEANFPSFKFRHELPGSHNPVSSIQFPGFTIKLHEKSLEEIIALESANT